jgi:GNAT superfamily N-acetyltransferase
MRFLTTLGSHHRTAMTDHLLALNPHDRGRRFLGVVNDGFVQRYIDGIDHARDIVLGAFHEARLVGLAHVALAEQDAAVSAEIGISVQADMRRHGWGKRLMVEALASAAHRCASCVHVLFHAENRAMSALARSLGGRVTRQGIESTAVFDTSPSGHLQPRSAPAKGVELRKPVRAVCAATRCGADTGRTGAAGPAW